MIVQRKIKNKSSVKRNKAGFVRILYKLILVIFFAVIVYSIFFSGFLKINIIEISGNNNIGRDEIIKIVNSQLEGKYLGLVDKNNVSLIRSRNIEEKMKGGLKKIEAVSIKRKFPSTLLVTVSERETMMALCNDSSCFDIDENGNAYEDIGLVSCEGADNGRPVLKDYGNREISGDEYIFNRNYLEFISKIRDRVKSELDIDLPNCFETPNRVSPDIRIVTNEGWRIFFNEDLGMEKELSMLKTVLDDQGGQFSRQNLEYIDLRADNKVYFKLKDGAQEQMDEQKDPEQPPVESKDSQKEKKKKKSEA